MFPRSYFGGHYFAPRFWPQSQGTVPSLLPKHNINMTAHDGKNKTLDARDRKTKTFIARDKKNKTFTARA